MTLVAFLALSEENQLYLVFDTGTWRETRWENGRFVLVYDMPCGLFAEVTHDRRVGRPVLLSAFDAA